MRAEINKIKNVQQKKQQRCKFCQRLIKSIAPEAGKENSQKKERKDRGLL